jgi:hypothetical protein
VGFPWLAEPPLKKQNFKSLFVRFKIATRPKPQKPHFTDDEKHALAGDISFFILGVQAAAPLLIPI